MRLFNFDVKEQNRRCGDKANISRKQPVSRVWETFEEEEGYDNTAKLLLEMNVRN